MSKDPFSPTTSICDLDRPAVHRAAPGVEFRKPERVRRMAARANDLIRAFARGGNAAVRAMLSPDELAARAREERVIGLPEKVISDAAFKEIADGIDGGGAGAVIPPADVLAREARAKAEADRQGRASPDDIA